MLRPLLLLLVPCSITAVHAQTWSGTSGPIADDGTASDFAIPVSGLSPAAIDSLHFGLETVCINVEHDRLADLSIKLIAPDGATALLSGFNGGNGHFYTNTCFRWDAPLSVTNNPSPFTGEFRPQGPMGLVNNGQDGNGTWRLRIEDANHFQDTGDLLGWSLTFGVTPANFYHLPSSDLPIVVIDTDNAEIPDDPKTPGTMGIVDNGPGQRNHTSDAFNGYNGFIGIELRGNTSQTFPKKSYGIELRNFLGDAYDVPLLGMPAENDWVLSASYSDKSLLNNALAYDLGQRMGHYAPRWRFVEVVLNGEYIGVFILMEKIKRGGDRVDIAKLRPIDVAGDDLTGGYIIKIDWEHGAVTGGWNSDLPPPANTLGQYIQFLYDYPEEPMPEQSAYIQAYVDSFETALAGAQFADPALGYARYADVPTFIDFLLVQELARNVDGYRTSTFLHKDKDSNGGKLRIGPLWDFDIAWGNANYCGGWDPAGWAYRFGDVCPNDQKQVPFWWQRFFEDPAFANAVKCRWDDLRGTVFATDRLEAWCDSMALVLDEAQRRNFTTWHVLGTTIWPNPVPVPTTYAGEIAELKQWIAVRAAWMDANMPGNCLSLSAADPLASATSLRIYPVPPEDHFYIDLPTGAGTDLRVRITDALGRTVLDERHATAARTLRIPWGLEHPAGTYLVQVEADDCRWTARLAVVR